MKTVQDLTLKAHLKELRLPTVLREYAKTAADAAKEGLDYEGYLQRLLSAEISETQAGKTSRQKDACRI